MSEDSNEPVVEEEPPQAEPKAAAPATKGKGTLTRDARGKPKDIKGTLNVLCAPRVVGTMYDTQRQVRIPSSGQNPTAVSDITAGSWLWCQMDKGLIVKVGK